MPLNMMRRLLPTALLAFTLAACGGSDEQEGPAGDTLAGQTPGANAVDIRDEPLTPATLKDPRIEGLSDAERRVLQDYVNRGIRRDSLENPNTPDSLARWLDSNLTVGQVIALYRGAERMEPLPPEGLPSQSPARVPSEQN